MPARPPNILWIVTSQWRAQACGYTGDPNASTPHLDALAAASVNYTQAVTPHPFGPFARAAVMTGVASPENGVRDYFDPLPANARTVAHALHERGYATAFFGKWHLGKRDPHAPLVSEVHARTVVPPEARGGFEFWEGFESGFQLNDPWLHGTRLPNPIQVRGYQSDILCERAGAWIAERELRTAGSKIREPQSAVRNWFAVISMEAPHPPYDAPAAGIVPRDSDSIVLPANVPLGGEAEARARRELAGYYTHIAATDRAIGSLLARSPASDTVVIFTSVHGDMHGAHGLFRKGWPQEESIRVPLLVRLPGESARKDDAAISLLDLTALTLACADGRPTAIDRNSSRISMPVAVALPHQCDRAWRGVRTPARKLILNEDGSPWLFFDLERDPLEQTNLVSDLGFRAEIARLRALV